VSSDGNTARGNDPRSDDVPVLSGRARWLAFLPRNMWRLSNADAHVRYTGPCGDTMEIWLRLSGNRVAKATFDTDGCAASIACGSAVTRLVQGLTVEQAYRINQEAVLKFVGGLPEVFEHCALLAATTLRMALEAACAKKR
jgi:nitrogen fixation NifU-like protein